MFKMEQVSPHFSWKEVLASSTADKLGIKNLPGKVETGNIIVAASRLEVIRKEVGPLKINSWYRCPTLNKAVGGASTSAHMSGWAIDIASSTLSPLELAKKIASMGVVYDQIIHEYGRWVHISFAPESRGELLTKFDGPYKKGLLSESEYTGK